MAAEMAWAGAAGAARVGGVAPLPLLLLQKQRAGTGTEAFSQQPTHSRQPPPLNVPWSPKTAPPARDQVFKHTSP